MKKKIFIMCISLCCVWQYVMAQTLSSTAQSRIVDGVSVSNFKMEHYGDNMVLTMTIDLSGLAVKTNRTVLLTPRLVNNLDSVDMKSVGIYGRRRYYFYVRGNESMLTGRDEISYKASEKPESVDYQCVIPYEEWMDGSVLSLYRQDYGCCNSILGEQAGRIGHHTEEFFPKLVYVQPQAEAVKSRSIEGIAFIDFPVNKTVIYPDYRHNATELGKIQSTIDSISNDHDVTITSVWLKGFASPEGSYPHNSELAMGRTNALKRYIQQLYRFDDKAIRTDYEPEDWEGLRRYVDQSALENKVAILAIIDEQLDYDVKEAKIKRTYPQEYRKLLQDCYPSLRHTDYRIAYNVRTYTDVNEIKKILREHPQKLGLNEFYLAAQEYTPGSDEFSEVFETAVRMYPDDGVANLNAANAAIRRNDLTSAERYLAKAGDSPEAIYARGALAIRKKDYASARHYLKEAKALGLDQATTTLKQLEQGRK